MDHSTVDALVGGGAGLFTLIVGLFTWSVKRNLSSLDDTIRALGVDVRALAKMDVVLQLLIQKVEGLQARSDKDHDRIHDLEVDLLTKRNAERS